MKIESRHAENFIIYNIMVIHTIYDKTTMWWMLDMICKRIDHVRSSNANESDRLKKEQKLEFTQAIQMKRQND